MTTQPSALRTRLLTTATAVALLATPAAAQEAEGFFTILGRVIFGAGTAKVAIDTPQAVSSVDQAELDRDQPALISDLFKSVPGVQGAGASARALGQAFNIRGIGNAEQTASETRIAVTVDGAPKFYESYRMGSFFGDLDLFKRVEILRGPASSTLYGAGAIGGAIAFTTKDPADFLPEGSSSALSFKAGYASNGNATKLGATWAHRAGNLEFLGALNTSQGDDMVDGSGVVIPGSAHKSWSGLGKAVLHFGADDDQTLTFTASRTDTNLDDAMVAMTGDLIFRGSTVSNALAQFGTNDVHAIDDTISLAWHKKSATNRLVDLTVQLSHTKTEADKSDFSYSFACGPGDSLVLCDSSYAYATNALKIENTADLSAGNWDNYLTFGVQISQQDRTGTTIRGPMPFHPEGTDKKTGLYAQGEFTWNDKLTLIPGVRVDFGNFSPSAAASANGGTDKDYTAISPKLAALYKVTDNFSIFGSIANTERMPSIDELYQYNPTPGRTPVRVASMGLEKEKARTYELGFAWQGQDVLVSDDSLQLKLTAFHNDLTDKIIVTPTGTNCGGGFCGYYSNLAAAEIWGAELELGYDSDRWFGQLAYSNVRSKDGTTGLTLADTPAENVVLTLGAKLPEQHLVVGWRASYFDDITTNAPATSTAAYDTHDLFVTWKPEEGALAGLSVNFTIENIFDKTYRNNLQLDNAPGMNAKLSIAKNFTW